MFWDKWIPKKFLAKSEICAVEACIMDTGEVFYFTHLRNKKGKLEIIETGSSENKPSLPPAILKNKIPLILVVNGKGIIIKKISLGENKEQALEEIVRQNMPAVNTADFYIQLYKQSDSSAFLVLSRKEQIDSLLDKFRSDKYEVADLLMGAPSVLGLQPLWSSHNSITTSLHKIELTNGVVDVIGPYSANSNEPVKIEGLSFHSNHTLGFSAGLSYLMRSPVAENNDLQLSSLANRHIEKNKFHFLMVSAVAIVFIVATTNVFFYSTYFDKNNSLETELSVYQGKYEQINQLLSDYQKNKGLIENAGILNRNRLSEYADRIGKTLPNEVTLSELNFNPKKEDEESLDSLVTFQNKNLILKGNCSKSFIVNEWISVLKMQKFIKDVSLEKFVYTNDELLPNFEIKLMTE